MRVVAIRRIIGRTATLKFESLTRFLTFANVDKLLLTVHPRHYCINYNVAQC